MPKSIPSHAISQSAQASQASPYLRSQTKGPKPAKAARNPHRVKLEALLGTISATMRTVDAIPELDLERGSWYQELQKRESDLTKLRDQPLEFSWLENPAITVPVRSPEMSLHPDIGTILEGNFRLAETCRNLLHKSLQSAFPPEAYSDFRPDLLAPPQPGTSRPFIKPPFVPSKLAKDQATFQAVDGQAFRTSRPFETRPIVVESVNPGFYSFSMHYRHSHNSDFSKMISERNFLLCWQVVQDVIPSMSDYLSHDERANRTLEMLRAIIPDTPEYKWVKECRVIDGVVAAIDLSNRRVKDGYITIIVEVKREAGEGGDAYFQSNAYHAISLMNPTAKDQKDASGAPKFLISVTGTSLQISAVVNDAKSGPQASLHLPGKVDLTYSCGINQREAACILYSLKKSLAILLKTIVPVDESGGLLPEPGVHYYTPHDTITDIPQVGLEGTGIVIVEKVERGALYLAELTLEDVTVPASLQEVAQHSKGANVEVRMTYPLLNESYGMKAQEFLARNGYATPVHRIQPNIAGLYPQDVDFPSSLSPLFEYYISPSLPGPTRDASGWITLDDLAEKPQQAKKHKSSIERTLENVVSALILDGVEYPFFSPKNVFVEVTRSRGGDYRLAGGDGREANIRLAGFHDQPGDPSSKHLTSEALREGWWATWPAAT